MLKAVAISLVALAMLFSADLAPSALAQSSEGAVETIVFLRHGEKPAAGLGQLTCKGLNRALALARVLPSMFGKPDYLFAPSPAQTKEEGAGIFNYVRPLATIEPTAVLLGMPVNTEFGFSETGRLEAELLDPRYRSATVFVAWEHALAEKVARRLVGNGSEVVPRWNSSDFDSLYVVKITSVAGTRHADFVLAHQGLESLSEDCPEEKKASLVK